MLLSHAATCHLNIHLCAEPFAIFCDGMSQIVAVFGRGCLMDVAHRKDIQVFITTPVEYITVDRL